MTRSEIDALLETIHVLRSPGGCPWDRKQTLPDAARYLLDEGGELLDAALAGDAENAAEELGDLLFMVCFCCEILGETAPYDFGDIARLGNEKLLRRHPHVFGDETASGETESQVHWNEIKAAEREAKGLPRQKASQLTDLPASSSPLRQAHVYQKDAAKSGFDWPDLSGIWEKLHEEIGELEAAVANSDTEAMRHEVGDLLLVTTNLARRLGVEADDALRLANRRFRSRFRYLESRFEDPRAQMPEATLDELEDLWREAKNRE